MALTQVQSGMLTGNNPAVPTTTAVGVQALNSSPGAGYNTAVGYQAGYTNVTGGDNVFVGKGAGYSSTAGSNVFVGSNAGYSVSTGVGNVFIGSGVAGSVNAAGYLVTTGSKNTIVGNFSGNQGGIDIRTSSNYIVLSDGDGNPRGYCDNSGVWSIGIGGTGQTWQNVTGSRSLGTTYTNSTGKPICVIVSLSQNNSGIGHQVYVGSISYNAGQNNSTGGITTSSYTIVPNGITYSVAAQAGESIGTWVELR